MENTTATHAAHIVLASAHMGDHEVVVMTRDEGMGAEAVATYTLGAYAEVGDARIRLATEGWRVLGEATEVQTGYYVVDIEKI